MLVNGNICIIETTFKNCTESRQPKHGQILTLRLGTIETIGPTNIKPFVQLPSASNAKLLSNGTDAVEDVLKPTSCAEIGINKIPRVNFLNADTLKI